MPQAWALEPYQPQSYTSPFQQIPQTRVKDCSLKTAKARPSSTPSFQLVGIFISSGHAWAFIRTAQGQIQQLQRGDTIANSTQKSFNSMHQATRQDACNSQNLNA